jgi:hypothetical protein
MPKGKRPSITDILAVHGTATEKQSFATAVMASDINATSDILAAIKRRLRAKAEPSTDRIDKAVAKIVTKYGKDQIIAALERLATVNPQENNG